MSKEEFELTFLSLKKYFNLLDLSNFNFLIFVSGLLLLLILIFSVIIKLIKTKNETQQLNKSKPTLEKTVNAELSNDNQNKNDFIDILVAIEEEMAAVRELYVSGYITKGIYISETDRLYSKAKIFGL